MPMLAWSHLPAAAKSAADAAPATATTVSQQPQPKQKSRKEKTLGARKKPKEGQVGAAVAV